MSGGGMAVRLGAAFAIGLAAALWLLPVLAGPPVQRLRLERDAAQARAEALELEVTKLKEAERRRPASCQIERARAELEGPDQRVGLAAERLVQQELAQALIGKRVEEVELIPLYSRYHGRLLQIDAILYRLEVQALVLGPELLLYGRLAVVKE